MRIRDEISEFLLKRGPLERQRLLLDGDHVADWRVIAFIARGGCGEVYRVRHDRTGEVAVIKVLCKDDEGLRRRFSLEADVLKRLSSDEAMGAECFPRLIDQGYYRGAQHPYVVLEELHEFKLPNEDAAVARFITLMCRSVAALHRNGYLHRDLKPANIMCRENGQPVIIDFGLAMRIADLGPMAKDRTSYVNGRMIGVGTIGSSAPEQANGEASVRSDVYALGALISDCFGRNPPEDWKPIVQRATSPKPEFRFASPEELAEAIGRRTGAVKIRCVQCRREIDRFASYCPHCGQITRLDARENPKVGWICCDKCGAEFGLKELKKSRGRCPGCHELLPAEKYCFHIPESRYLVLYSVTPWWFKGLMIVLCALAVVQAVETVLDVFAIGGSEEVAAGMSPFFIGRLMGALFPAALAEALWRIRRAIAYRDEILAYRIARKSGTDLSAVKPHGYTLSRSAILVFCLIVGGVGVAAVVNRFNDLNRMASHRERDDRVCEAFLRERQRLCTAWGALDLGAFIANPEDYLVATGDVERTQQELKRASRIAMDIVANADRLLETGLHSVPPAQREQVIRRVTFERDDFWLWFRLCDHSLKVMDHFTERNGGDANGLLEKELGVDDREAVGHRLEEELVEYDAIMERIRQLEGCSQFDSPEPSDG